MLNKLFGSKARAEILKIFLTHPDNRYFIRQLARELDMQVNSIRRELENLESFGLLTSETVIENVEAKEIAPDDSVLAVDDSSEIKPAKRGLPFGGKVEKKYFKVDKKFVLYEEMKSLMLKSKTMYEKNFIDKIREIGQPKLFVLTGIFVDNPSSSTDMLIVGHVDKSKLVSVVSELEKEMEREINYTIMDEKEFLYRREITDIFLYGILENKKIVIHNEFSFLN